MVAAAELPQETLEDRKRTLSWSCEYNTTTNTDDAMTMVILI